jgi:hypothetical protein
MIFFTFLVHFKPRQVDHLWNERSTKISKSGGEDGEVLMAEIKQLQKRWGNLTA